jgi:hypothetical protein
MAKSVTPICKTTFLGCQRQSPMWREGLTLYRPAPVLYHLRNVYAFAIGGPCAAEQAVFPDRVASVRSVFDETA